jgi:hypothetical protein
MSMNQNSSSSLGVRIDYKNMKVLSIQEFQQMKMKEEERGKLNMYDYLHNDSRERLGSKSIIS